MTPAKAKNPAITFLIILSRSFKKTIPINTVRTVDNDTTGITKDASAS